jgi:hypothetical protein
MCRFKSDRSRKTRNIPNFKETNIYCSSKFPYDINYEQAYDSFKFIETILRIGGRKPKIVVCLDEARNILISSSMLMKSTTNSSIAAPGFPLPESFLFRTFRRSLFNRYKDPFLRGMETEKLSACGILVDTLSKISNFCPPKHHDPSARAAIFSEPYDINDPFFHLSSFDLYHLKDVEATLLPEMDQNVSSNGSPSLGSLQKLRILTRNMKDAGELLKVTVPIQSTHLPPSCFLTIESLSKFGRPLWHQLYYEKTIKKKKESDPVVVARIKISHGCQVRFSQLQLFSMVQAVQSFSQGGWDTQMISMKS